MTTSVQRILELVALFLLLCVVMLRPLVAETHDSAGTSISTAIGSLTDATPLRTSTFDIVILVAGLAWAAGRVLGTGRAYRPTGLEWGLPLIFLGALISCLYAGNKRLAINGAIDWLCLPILAIVLTQLVQSRIKIRLLAAVIVASAAVQAVQCYEQHWSSFDATREMYEQNKVEFWGKQGVPLDSARVELFERRMLAQEAQGFLPHSNIAGAHLLLCAFVAGGLAIARWRASGALKMPLAAGIGAVAATIAGAISLTGSLGAVFAGVGGVTLCVLLWACRAWIAQYRFAVFASCWMLFVLVATATVLHGRHHGTLPHSSLNFRWQYWRVSAPLIAEHVWTGVGSGNFGRHYLQHKPIDVPEEISNPHNFLVQVMAEWGILGAVGLVAMLVGASWTLARGEMTSAVERGPPNEIPQNSALLLWSALLLLVLVFARMPLLGTNDPNYLYYATVMTSAIWLPVFFLCAVRFNETVETRAPAERAMRMGAAVGLFAFLVQDLISFALFVPGSATVLFAVLPLALAPADPVGNTETRGLMRRWLPFMSMSVLMVTALALGLIPILRAQSWVMVAEKYAMDAHSSSSVTPLLERAALEDPVDPQPLLLKARWLAQGEGTGSASIQQFHLAVDAFEQAISRDPLNQSLYNEMARILMQLGHAGDTDAFTRAVTTARRGHALYPLNPEGLIKLADVESAVAVALDSDELRTAAISHYQEALTIDNARPEWERIRGLREWQRQEVARKIAALRDSGGATPD